VKKLIVQWAVTDTTTVTTLMDGLYYHGHARYLPAKTSIRSACGLWSEFFGSATLAQITPDKIRDFIVWLDKAGYAPVIVRTLSVGAWALRRASRGDLARMVAAIAQQERSSEPPGSHAPRQPKGYPKNTPRHWY
jgi:hypothetical protein